MYNIYTNDIKSACSSNKLGGIYQMRLSNTRAERERELREEEAEFFPSFFAVYVASLIATTMRYIIIKTMKMNTMNKVHMWMQSWLV